VSARRARTVPVDPDAAPLFAVASSSTPAAPAAPAAAGRHERAVLAAARHPASPLRDRRHAAARTTLRALARALDVAERKDDAYAVAQLVRPMRELLADCGMLPDLADHGPADDTLAGLGAATLGD